MATDPFGLYVVIAPIAAVFAGFGSLASGLGQRAAGADARVDATRLTLMLFASLSATLLGLLPATLASLFGDDQLAVRVSALVAVIAMVSYAASGVRRARKLRHASGFSKSGVLANLACSLIALAAFSLCSLGIPAGRIAGLYLLGLVGLLGSSVVMFSRVIASMLRAHDEAGDPS
jgi:hypothetical protein